MILIHRFKILNSGHREFCETSWTTASFGCKRSAPQLQHVETVFIINLMKFLHKRMIETHISDIMFSPQFSFDSELIIVKECIRMELLTSFEEMM